VPAARYKVGKEQD